MTPIVDFTMRDGDRDKTRMKKVFHAVFFCAQEKHGFIRASSFGSKEKPCCFVRSEKVAPIMTFFLMEQFLSFDTYLAEMSFSFSCYDF